MDYPRAYVLLRLLNAGEHVDDALQSLLANRYPGEVVVYVRIDHDTTDATEPKVDRAALARPTWEWHIVRSERHEDLWEATWRAYREIWNPGVVYTLDGDNLFEPDRLRRGWEVDPRRRLLCINRMDWRGLATVPENRTVPTVEQLLAENRYDSLNQRLDAEFCRGVLAPFMEREPLEAVPDYFANLVAATYSRICVHEPLAGYYRKTQGSLMSRGPAFQQGLDARTHALYRSLAEDGTLARYGSIWATPGASPVAAASH